MADQRATIVSFDPRTGAGTLKTEDGALRRFDARQLELVGIRADALKVGLPVTATISGGGVGRTGADARAVSGGGVVCRTGADAKAVSGGGVVCLTADTRSSSGAGVRR
ncbi:MAG: hypothetical protein H6713_01210 [Myxococcales bacterium]|nr:hypothetical protein [Myxococcales bacterium]MCB9748601.1 hypothetical protein [Myxococcales bacterium]